MNGAAKVAFAEERPEADQERQGGEDESPSNSLTLPGISRRAPPPLTNIDEKSSPEQPARIPLADTLASPAAAAARAFLRRCGTGPITILQQSPRSALTLMTPKGTVMQTPKAVLMSPMAINRRGTAAFPVESTASGISSRRSPLSSATESIAPGSPSARLLRPASISLSSPRSSLLIPASSPVAARSPLAASPLAASSPRIIPREALLQARQVALRIEQGPPGMAMYAPTPTSQAKSFGFAYPQPGFVKTIVPPNVAARTRRHS